MPSCNALKELSSCFITLPECWHVPEISCAEQSRHFPKSVGCYLEKDGGNINRPSYCVVIHARIELHSIKLE